MKIISLVLFALSIAYSGEMIHGNVYGLNQNGEETELSGVRVWWMGTELGGFSDENGHFMFDLHPNSKTLIFQIAGYPTDTLFVENTNEFIFHTLEPFKTSKDVVVTAELPKKEISRSSIQNEEVITSKQLSSMACCNVSEAFEVDPSVNVEFTDPVSGSKQIKLMGLHGKYSQIMIEKIPFVRGINIPFGLSYIPGPWVESISISKGSADVTSGFESTTGQINIELKKPNQIDDGIVNGFGDIGGRAEFNKVFNKEISNKVSTIGFVNANLIPNLIDMNSDGFFDRPSSRNLNLMNKFFFNGDKTRGQIGLRFLIDNRQSEFQNQIISNNFEIDNSRAELFFKSGTAGGNYSMGLIGSVSWQENRTDNLLNQSNNTFLLQNTSAQVSYQFDYGFNDAPLESDNKLSLGFSTLYDNFQNQVTNGGSFNSNLNYLTPGLFINYKNMSLDYVDFSLGFRADYNDINGAFFTPRTHIKITPTDNLDIRLSLGAGHRYTNPLAENVFLFLYDNNADYNSITSFAQNQMESAINYGGTVNWFFDFGLEGISFSAEYFNTVFSNRVIIDQYRYSGAYSPQIYETSNAYSESYGADLIIPLTDYLEFNFSGRIENSFFENQNGDMLREPLSAIIKSNNTVYYDINSLDISIRFTASYFGQGKRTVERENGNSFQDFDPFWIFGGQINKEFDSIKLEIFAGVQNLSSYTIFEDGADEQAVSANYFGTDLWGPLMGRNIYFGFNWRGF